MAPVVAVIFLALGTLPAITRWATSDQCWERESENEHENIDLEVLNSVDHIITTSIMQRIMRV